MNDLQRFVQAVLQHGYRPFIAKSGDHGFYTDDAGTRIVTFQFYRGNASVSGNYTTNKPGQTGTGWHMADVPDLTQIDKYFKAVWPTWAVGDARARYTTLDEFLGAYQISSQYREQYPTQKSLNPKN